MEVDLLVNRETKEKELNFAQNQFFKMLYVDFGLRVNRKIREWYNMSWEEFKEELARNKVRISECLIHDWEMYFNNHKRKVQSLLNQ